MHTRQLVRRLAPSLVLAVLAVVPVTVLLAQQPETAMSGGTSHDPKIPFKKYTLPNGLEVILHQDNSVPLVAVDVWYHVGSGDEVPGKSGYAHLFEHMMFQGTKNTGEDRHFPILQEIGGTDVNGTTNTNRTCYFEVVPSNQLETALWLESDRMGYLPETITEKSLGNQRDVVRNERRQNYDNVPYGKEMFEVSALLYPEGHPYRYMTIGLHEDLAVASVDDVKGFFRKWYVPANATLTLAGDIDLDGAQKLVQKWFGTFPVTQKPQQPAVSAPSVQGPQRKTIPDNLAKLRRVHYAWNSPALFRPGDAELDILASALGQEGTGRLYKILVLEKQWARSVAVYQESRQLSSIFHVQVDLKDNADLAEVEKIVDAELDKLMSAPITDAELHRAVVRYESQYVWGLEPYLARAETLQMCNHFWGDPDGITRDLDRYRTATAAGVRAVAAKVLPNTGRVEIVTMPAQADQAAAATPVPAARPTASPSVEAAPAALAFPNEAFRASQPKPGQAKPLVPPGIQHFQIGDGIDVYLVERHALPTISLDLVMPGGSINDPADRIGRAGLCTNLLDDGTEKLDKVAFEEAQADLASSVSAWAGSEQQGVSATTLTKNLDRTLDLWSDVLQHPGLRQADHDRNIQQSIASIQQSKGAPGSIARRIAGAIYYGPQHPFGQIATEASARAVTLAECRQYVADYLKPRGAQLYVVGDITRAQIEGKVASRLAAWKGAPKPSATAAVPQPQPVALYFVDVPGAPQSQILMGHPGPVRQATDFIPTGVMMGILGGDFSSRINMNLREDKGWAYGAGAAMRYTRSTGMFRVGASVAANATKDAVVELYKEIKKIADAPVSDQELEREKSGEVLALPAAFATGADILGTYRDLIFYGLPMDYYATVGQKVTAVTKDDVQQVAKKYTQPDQFRVIVVGDGKTVLTGLTELVQSKALGEGAQLVLLDADGKPKGEKP